MPYADNLYSADDSDVESFSNELSPTDGYFSNRDHPQDVMVPDPSLETGPNTADSKAREAHEEAAASSEYHVAHRPVSPEMPASSHLRVSGPASPSHYSPPSPTAYAPRSPTSSHRHQDELYSESSPLLHSGAPPPAYSAAPLQPATQHFNQNYNTISARQLESGFRGPESMGGSHEFNERSPLWVKQVKSLPRWRLCRNILLVALVLSLAVGFIVAAAKSGESKRNKGDPSRDKSPSAPPRAGHRSYCSSGSIQQSDSLPIYEFKSRKELVILQVTGGEQFAGGAARVHTTGEIILRRQTRSEADQDTGYITFDVWLSDLEIKYRVEMDADAQALKVISPEFSDLSPTGYHCLSIEITVWIPFDASFETVIVEATSLSIRFMDDVDFHVSKISEIAGYSGNIYLPSQNLSSAQSSKSSGAPPGFSSREISVGTSSGDVTGAVLLYDLVKIDTESGNIDITVEPQPATHNGGSNIAQLTLAAASGNIRCRLPIYNENSIPDRDYHTSVTTRSGNVGGDYLIGTEADFKVISGNLKIAALPTTFSSSTFKTDSTSGSSYITVLEPLDRHRTVPALPADNIDIGNDDPYQLHPAPRIAPIDSDAADKFSRPSASAARASPRHLKHLTSYHNCGSGSLKIHYPARWDGEISAVSISGNIRVSGDGVRIIRDSKKNWVYHEVLARKGAGAEYASAMDVHGVSGDVDVWVGEGCGVVGPEWCRMDAVADVDYGKVVI